MKDREKREAAERRRQAELDGTEIQDDEVPEDILIGELGDLLEFVESNKMCVDLTVADDAFAKA